MHDVEAVEAEHEEREDIVRAALAALDRPFDEIEEQNPIRQPRQGVRELRLGNVGQAIRPDASRSRRRS